MAYTDFLQLVKYSPRPVTLRFAKPSHMMINIEADGLPVRKIVLTSLPYDIAPKHPNPEETGSKDTSPRTARILTDRTALFAETLNQTGKTGRLLEINEANLRSLAWGGCPEGKMEGKPLGYRAQSWM
jgi:hypothetical protein